ncbi:MAG: M28 family peptidase [Marinilabiliales bacterium]
MLVFIINLYSQDIDYAKTVINDLSSKKFHGRAYTHNGALKAAKYIRNELIKWDVKPFTKDYFQYFNINTNSIKSIKYVKINGKLINPGKDYTIYNTSSTCKGKFDVIKIDSTFFSKEKINDITGKFVLVDESDFTSKNNVQLLAALEYTDLIKIKGVIVVSDKNPSQTMSVKPVNHAVIKIKRDSSLAEIKNIEINYKNKFLKNIKTQNVVGYIPGEVDTFIMFGAHYDHLGEMGKDAYFPGANDNASGCAMLLNLAKYYSKNKPHYSLIFAFFSAEEVGILGSQYMSEQMPVNFNKIKFFFNLDLVGTGEEGIKIVNGTIFKKEFSILDSLNNVNNYFVKIGKRGEARNSDHYYFYKKGVPSFFIYTLGGSKEYHNVFDTPCSISLCEFNDLFLILRDFISNYQ